MVGESPLGHLSQALKNSHKFCSEEKPGKVVLDKSTDRRVWYVWTVAGAWGVGNGWAGAAEAAKRKWRVGDEGP